MTKVFIGNISELNEDITLYRDYISEYRCEKLKRIKNSHSQKQGVGAELLLAGYLGRKPQYTIDENGKPTGEETEFNFSHSGDIAVCAVSDFPVGVDVEKIRDVNMDIARKKFCPSECEAIFSSANPTESFFEYWVKKESYVKALGEGLRIPLKEINVDEITDRKFHTYKIKGYKLCVCTIEDAEFILSEF